MHFPSLGGDVPRLRTFFNFELIEKYHVSLKKLMQQGICNPEFYGDLIYKLRKSLEIQTSLIFSNVLQPVSREQGIL